MPITDFTPQGTLGSGSLPKRYDIVAYQGDTFKFKVNFKDGQNNALDLTGAVPFLTLTATIGPPDVPIQPTVEATDPATGQYTIVFADEVTDQLDPAITYLWEFGYELNGEIYTKLGGEFSVTQDITENV